MAIYTKKGDRGHTSLFTGEIIPKNDNLIHALGTIDECNAIIGMALSFLPQEEHLSPYREQWITIQHALFDIGAAVATPRTRASDKKIDQTRFNAQATEQLEQWIDAMDEKLPPLKNFILPGGHAAASIIHTARNVCRRAERHAIPLNLHEDVSDNVMKYLNRLSDYFFMAARIVNHELNYPETTWKGRSASL